MRYATKPDLMRDIETQYERLRRSLAAVPVARYDEPGVWGDDWTINDLLAHLSAWHGLFLGWYHAGLRGEMPALPAPGYKWNETPRLNRDLWRRHRGRATDELLRALDASHAQVVEVALGLSPEDLLEPGRFGWTRKNALVTYLGANTASHYRFAQKVLKRWLRTTTGGPGSRLDTPRIACSFETARLRAHPWPSGREAGGAFDLPAVVAGLLSARVTEPLPESWQGAYSRSRAARWIEDRDREGTVLLVERRTDGHPIGLVLLHDAAEAGDPRSELRLGYLVSESHWGRGYASELVGGVVAWARTSPYGRIVAGVDPENAASVRVLEKSGFRKVHRAGAGEAFYVIQT